MLKIPSNTNKDQKILQNKSGFVMVPIVSSAMQISKECHTSTNFFLPDCILSSFWRAGF